MSDDKKSTDPGLSAAERKTLRGHEAQPAGQRDGAWWGWNEGGRQLRRPNGSKMYGWLWDYFVTAEGFEIRLFRFLLVLSA
jgi:hypothetical protein